MTTITAQLVEDPAVAAELEALYNAEPVNWIPAHCKIIDKDGELIPLEPNVTQLKVLSVIHRLELEGRPVRIIILKARQEGITSLGCALQYKWCDTKPNQFALVSAHEDDSSTEIFSKVRLMQDENRTKRPEQYSNRKEVTFEAPHRSSLLVKTAGKENLGRGTTIHRFHASELAFWPRAKKTLRSVLQCIPKRANTSVIIESTANGIGGEFYDRWEAAVNGETDYIPLFFAWHDFPEYSTPILGEFERTRGEQVLLEAYDLDNAQLQWRRDTIANECGGDEQSFWQEYPSCAEEAFLVSGRPVFLQTQLRQMAARCSPPNEQGEMRSIGDVSAVAFQAEPQGQLEVWERPQPDRLYAIGADSAEGLDPDEVDDPDANSSHVIDVFAKRIVAKLSGQMDTDIFADQLTSLGWWYNCALIGPEVNNKSGGVLISTLKRAHYPSIYFTPTKTKIADQLTDRLGWRTDVVTRELMLTDLGHAVRFEWLDVPSKQTVHQMRCFVRDKTGKAIAQQGEKDDDVISLAITLQMAIQVAGTKTIEGLASTSRTFEKRSLPHEVNKERDYVRELAMNDAVDNLEDIAEWEEEHE